MSLGPILIHRASRQKDGWKMRFGCDVGNGNGNLIVTVEIGTERLGDAMVAGESVAKPLFVAMQQFNLEQVALGGS